MVFLNSTFLLKITTPFRLFSIRLLIGGKYANKNLKIRTIAGKYPLMSLTLVNK
jgi:hypothetical protein